MTATENITEAALALQSFTILELAAKAGVSETTTRKVVKELTDLIEAGDKKGTYQVTASDPEPEPVHATVEAINAALAVGDAPTKKHYTRHAIPLTRTVRINQITKAEIKVASADEVDVENPGGKWATICLTHDAMGWFDLVLDAHFASTYPEFCPTCAPLLVGKVGRRRAKKA